MDKVVKRCQLLMFGTNEFDKYYVVLDLCQFVMVWNGGGGDWVGLGMTTQQWSSEIWYSIANTMEVNFL